MDEERAVQEMNSQAPASADEQQGEQPLEVVVSRAKRLVVRADEDVRLLAELQDAMDAVASAHRDAQRAFDRAFYPLVERLLRSPLRKRARIWRLARRCTLALAAVLLVAALRRHHRR